MQSTDGHIHFTASVYVLSACPVIISKVNFTIYSNLGMLYVKHVQFVQIHNYYCSFSSTNKLLPS